MKKLISLILLLSTTTIFADTDDNEIIITQTGDTLKLYIDQEGFGNKIGGNNFQSNGTAMLITGATLEFDLDFTGNSNILFGPVTADNSTYKLDFTGDSNIIDWTIGGTGSSDDSDINFSVTGSSNTFDLDQGSAFSAEPASYKAISKIPRFGSIFNIEFLHTYNYIEPPIVTTANKKCRNGQPLRHNSVKII